MGEVNRAATGAGILHAQRNNTRPDDHASFTRSCKTLGNGRQSRYSEKFVEAFLFYIYAPSLRSKAERKT